MMKKVFLGGLPKNITDEQLRDRFANYGTIIDYVVMRDSHTKESRGFGFIEFEDEDSVNDMLKSRPHIIENREIEVRRAMPKEINHDTIHERTKRLFIGGLSFDVTDEVLLKYYTDKFSKYGKVESAEVKRDRESSSSRGFGFVTFDTEDAVDAILILDPKPTCFGRNCEVKKSEPKRSDDNIRRRRYRPRSPVEPPPHRYYSNDYERPSYSSYGRSTRPSRYPRDPYYDNMDRGYAHERPAPYRQRASDSRYNQSYDTGSYPYPPPPGYSPPSTRDYRDNSISNPYASREGGGYYSSHNMSHGHPRHNNNSASNYPPRSGGSSAPYQHFNSGYRTRDINPHY